MKYPVFFTCLVCLLTVFPRPFTSADAAQLWNKPEAAKSGKTGKTYYGRKKRTGPDKGVLYNRQGQTRKSFLHDGHLKAVHAYSRVSMPGQKPSRLWGIMAPSAVKNRQADIEFALQQEYNIRKKVAADMLQTLKLRAQQRAADERRHQDALARYAAEQTAIKQHKLEKKQRALGLSAAGPAQKSAGTYKRKEKGTGLKKPRRLFNDPNR